jgi:hypothetical protein
MNVGSKGIEMKLHFSCPDEVVKELDKHIDGVRYRNRTHLMFTIFMDWLSNKEKIRSERMRKTVGRFKNGLGNSI